MKVGILTHIYPLHKEDGKATASLFVPNFAKELKNLGCEVCIFTPDTGKEIKDSEGLSIRKFNWLGKDKKLGHLNFLNPLDNLKLLSLILKGSKDLFQFIKEENITHCLALWAIPSGFFAELAKKKSGISYSVWALGSDIWRYGKYPVIKNIVKSVLHNADFLFADGIKLAKEVETTSKRKCEFLPTTRTLSDDAGIKLNLDKAKTNFLFIGRLEKAKGIDILVEAFHLLCKEKKDVYLHILGGGSLEKFIKRKVSAYSLKENIRFYGFAAPSECAAYMKECDCLVIPSRLESIPLVFSEAMKVKIPVIVSDVGDMGELVRKFSVGEIADTCSQSLKESLVKFMNKPSENYHKNMDLAASQFDLSEIAKKYLKFISDTHTARPG